VTGRRPARILLSMPEVESAQVEPDTMSTVELQIQAGEPIRGQLSASGIGALPFHGWLELVAAIQSVRRLLSPDAPGPPV
jgi:hypothetical protein